MAIPGFYEYAEQTNNVMAQKRPDGDWDVYRKGANPNSAQIVDNATFLATYELATGSTAFGPSTGFRNRV